MDEMNKVTPFKSFKDQITGYYDEERSIKEETGSRDSEKYVIKEYPFDKYHVKIKLTLNNEFVGIEEIKINKQFLSHRQKKTPLGFHDVDEFYRD